MIEPLCAWYETHKRDLPWRRSRDPYRVWVSEIMLQQTRVEAVKPYYERFIAAMPTVRDLAEMPEQRLLKYWEGLGYYSRVRNLQKGAQAIVEAQKGEQAIVEAQKGAQAIVEAQKGAQAIVEAQKGEQAIEEAQKGEEKILYPETAAEWQKIPGVGPYTAGAIASIAFGEAVPAVDGNVLRVIARYLMIGDDILMQKTKSEITEILQQAMCEHFFRTEESADANELAELEIKIQNEAEKSADTQTVGTQSEEGQIAETRSEEGQIAETRSEEGQIAEARSEEGQTTETPGQFNQALMELGATVCLPNGTPECAKCPLSASCLARQNGCENDLPVRIKKTRRRTEEITVLVIRDDADVVIRRRGEKGLLAGLFEFPNVDRHLDAEEALEVVRSHGIEAVRIEPIGDARHIFSHITWEMRGYLITVGQWTEVGTSDDNNNCNQDGWIRVSRDKIEREYPIPSAFSAYTTHAGIQLFGKGEKHHV